MPVCFYPSPEDWYLRLDARECAAKSQKKQRHLRRFFREDIAKHPDNGWSLFGLQQSLRAEGKTAEADEVRRKLQSLDLARM